VIFFSLFFKISEHGTIKNWAYLYKIKYFKIATYDMSVIKVVLLFTYGKRKSFSDIFMMSLKNKNALF